MGSRDLVLPECAAWHHSSLGLLLAVRPLVRDLLAHLGHLLSSTRTWRTCRALLGRRRACPSAPRTPRARRVSCHCGQPRRLAVLLPHRPGSRTRWSTLYEPEDRQGRVRCVTAITRNICVSRVKNSVRLPFGGHVRCTGALLRCLLGPSSSEPGSPFARQRR